MLSAQNYEKIIYNTIGVKEAFVATSNLSGGTNISFLVDCAVDANYIVYIAIEPNIDTNTDENSITWLAAANVTGPWADTTDMFITAFYIEIVSLGSGTDLIFTYKKPSAIKF